MYNVIKTVIETTPFNLDTILTKINTQWVRDALTDDERTALSQLAMERAVDANQNAPLQAQIDALRTRIEALEGKTESTDTIAEYVTPESTAQAYHYGDFILFRGSIYVCTRVGKNVMHDPITYPIGWTQITQAQYDALQDGSLTIDELTA